MKRFLAIALSFVLIFSLCTISVSADTAPEIKVIPSVTSMKAGDDVTFQITTSAVAKIRAVNFDLLLPSTVFDSLTVVNNLSDPWSSKLGALVKADTTSNGSISASIYSDTGVTYVGTWDNPLDMVAQTLLTIKAHVKANATLGSAPLLWNGYCSYTDSSGSKDVNFDKADSAISVYAPLSDPMSIAITSPKKYEMPQQTIADGTNYTGSAITWSPAPGATFAPGTAYTATATVTPAANYKFTGSATISVAGVDSLTIVSWSETAITFAAKFPATAASALDSISITPGTAVTLPVPTSGNAAAQQQLTASGLDGTTFVDVSGSTIWCIVDQPKYQGITIDSKTGLLTVTTEASKNTFTSGSLIIKVAAVSGTKTAEKDITVTRVPSAPNGLTISGGADTVLIPVTGETKTPAFAANMTDQYGNMMPSIGINWSIAPPSYTGVSIDATTGVVTVNASAKNGIGSAPVQMTVTASNGLQIATKIINIKRDTQKPTTMVLENGANSASDLTVTVPVGGGPVAQTKRFLLTVTDQYDTLMTGLALNWAVQNNGKPVNGVTIAGDATGAIVTVTGEAAAAVTNTTGLTFSLGASYNGSVISNVLQIQVVRAAPVATRLEITRDGSLPLTADTLVIPVTGQTTYTYNVTAYDQYGTVMTNPGGAWSKSISGTGFDATGNAVTVTNTASGSGSLTYTAGTAHATVAFTLAKLDADWTKVTVNSAAKVYGTATLASFVSFTGPATTIGGTTLNGTFAVENGTKLANVSDRDVTVTFTITSPGAYQGVKLSKTYTKMINVTPATLTMTPDSNQSKVYGAAEPTLTATFTGAVNGETPKYTGTMSRVPGENAGTYAITGAGIVLTDNAAGNFVAGNYTLSFTNGKELTITKKTLDPSMITVAPVTYTGVAQTPTPTVTDTATITTSDYAVSWTNNVNAGLATVSIAALNTGNYSGSAFITFTIKQKPLDSTMITGVTPAANTYTGKEIKPTPILNEATLKATDYTLSYVDNVNAGTTAKVTLTGKSTGNYSGTASYSFKIDKANLSVIPTLSGTATVGSVLTAITSYSDSDVTYQWLQGGADISGATAKTYTLTSADSNKIISVRLTGKDVNYLKSSAVTSPEVTVAKEVISGSVAITGGSSPVIQADTLGVTITGIKPTVAQANLTYKWTGTLSGTTTTLGTAATQKLTGVAADTVVTVSVTAGGDYTGALAASVTVGKAPLAAAAFGITGTNLKIDDVITPAGTINGAALVSGGADYTLQWQRDGVDIAGATAVTYKVTKADLGATLTLKATGKGNYTGSVTATGTATVIATAPDAPVLAVATGNAQLTVSWTATANGSAITGYTLYMKSGTGSYDAGTAIAAGTTSKTITGLTNGTAYTFKMTATNGLGVSPESAEKTATPSVPAVGGGTASASGTTTTSIKQDGTKVTFTYSDEDALNSVGSLDPKENLALDAKGQTGADTIVVSYNILKDLDEANKAGGNSGVQFTLPKVQVTFDSAAVAVIVAQAGGKDVTLTAKQVDSSTLTDAQKKAAGTNPVYSFSLMAGSTSITNFGGGTATITVPTTLAEGQSAEGITIFYLDSAGNLIQVDNCTYDPVNHTVTFTVTHFSLYVVTYSAFPFTDVKASDWYFNAVKFVAGKGVFTGVTKTLFAPNTAMNRAMFATVLGRLVGAAVDQTKATSFTDVPVDGWSSGYITWAAQLGIVTGYGNGQFGPNDQITREQMAVMMYNYAKSLGVDVSFTNTDKLYAFKDGNTTDSWAVNAMAWAVNTGLMGGTGDNSISPKAYATRAQVAQVILNLAQLLDA